MKKKIDEDSIIKYMEFAIPKLSPSATFEMLEIYKTWNRRPGGICEGKL